jgi:hypothetical protein
VLDALEFISSCKSVALDGNATKGDPNEDAPCRCIHPDEIGTMASRAYSTLGLLARDKRPFLWSKKRASVPTPSVPTLQSDDRSQRNFETRAVIGEIGHSDTSTWTLAGRLGQHPGIQCVSGSGCRVMHDARPVNRRLVVQGPPMGRAGFPPGLGASMGHYPALSVSGSGFFAPWGDSFFSRKLFMGLRPTRAGMKMEYGVPLRWCDQDRNSHWHPRVRRKV